MLHFVSKTRNVSASEKKRIESQDGKFPKLTESDVQDNCRSSAYKVGMRYVNGNDVAQRLYLGEFIAATVRGKKMVYHTRVYYDPKDGRLESDCSCPSDSRLCRHGAAVALAFARQPQTFFDVIEWVEKLTAMPTEDLQRILAQTALENPAILGAFGVHGMEDVKPKPRTSSDR